MDLTTCAVSVVAGSAGGAIAGYCVGRRRSARSGRRARGPGTGRAWPGQRREDASPGDGGGVEGP